MARRYKYYGLPLVSHSAAQLALDYLLYEGDAVSMDTLLEVIPKNHVKQGGLAPHGDPTSVIKRGIQQLRDQGLIYPPQRNWWRAKAGVEPPNMSAVFEEEPVAPAAAPPVPENPQVPALIREANQTASGTKARIIGDGKERIVISYMPLYKMVALQEGKHVWQCKIVTDSGGAIREEPGPEKPETGLSSFSSERPAVAFASGDIVHKAIVNGQQVDMTASEAHEFFNAPQVDHSNLMAAVRG